MAVSTPWPGPFARSSAGRVEAKRSVGPGATLCEVRLETGKTHQIRVHLAEAGHPLETITGPKQRQLTHMAQVYLAAKGMENVPMRSQLAAVPYPDGGTEGPKSR